jgi:hypothetical protein
MCESGLHASRNLMDALQYAPGPYLRLVEVDDIVTEQPDKLVCRRRRTIQQIGATQLLREFARWCALQVIHLWDAPPIVRQYLETGDAGLRYGEEAAWDDLRYATWDDLRYAAEAARAAAWSASAARDSATWAASATRDAASSARDAASSARNAAWDAEAARNAAWAARAAAWEARDAARDAAWEAQSVKLQQLVDAAFTDTK